MKKKLSRIGLVLLVDFILVGIVLFVLISKTTDLYMEDATPEELPDHVEITHHYVLLEDGGVNGELIGCGDSIVKIDSYESEQFRYLEDGSLPEGAILESIRELIHTSNDMLENIPSLQNFYTAAYSPDLIIEKVELDGSLARVYFTGSVSFGGVCDVPRFENQLELTATSFPEVDSVEFYMNGSVEEWEALFISK